MSPFHHLSRPTLKSLSEALSHRRLLLPCTPISLNGLVPDHLVHLFVSELNHLHNKGMTPHHIAYSLNLLAEEGQQSLYREPFDLVWTGPELPGSESRDTAVVVKDLFRTAQHSLLISSFAIDWGSKGRELFQPLAQRMESIPNLQVRLFINIQRKYSDPTPSSTIIKQFTDNFRQSWPGARLPEVFHDPRALDPTTSANACLHAKCLVVDELRTLITSANFTEAAHQRNIEAGILIENPTFAKAIRSQFETLASQQILCRVTGL